MSTITEDLADALSGVLRSGDFFASGTCEIPAPGLVVAGVGPISLPVLPAQAQALIAAADRAPYGRGARTLVDTDVRRTWQIDADQVDFTGRTWARSLTGIVARAAAGLGVDGLIEAQLYKLLVYDEGAFFLSHRDSEKSAGMFATLVVALPSQFVHPCLTKCR